MPDPRTRARPEEPAAATTGQASAATHHAHIRGAVVGRDGQPLGGVQLVADRVPATATMPRGRAVTRADGTFTVPLQATLHGDSARVQVKLVGFGFIYATGGDLPADSVVVPVTMVPATRPPNVYTARLTLPVSRR